MGQQRATQPLLLQALERPECRCDCKRDLAGETEPGASCGQPGLGVHCTLLGAVRASSAASCAPQGFYSQLWPLPGALHGGGSGGGGAPVRWQAAFGRKMMQARGWRGRGRHDILFGHTARVRCLALQPSAGRLFTGGRGGHASICGILGEGRLLRLVPGAELSCCAELSGVAHRPTTNGALTNY